MSVLDELKRRNVIRVAIAYLAVAWLILQIADVVLGNLGAEPWIIRSLMLLLAIGFPVALAVAWAFELTPDGFKRESEVDRSTPTNPTAGRKIDRLIIVVLTLALAVLLIDRFDPSRVQQGEMHATNPVAVLPFVAMTRGADDQYYADGITEEILNALAQIPGLQVTARTSSFHFRARTQTVSEIAEILGATHIVDGSVRRGGNQTRITAQLIRAEDGVSLWSETYDLLDAESLKVQADIAEQVAAALNVFLDDALRQKMRDVGVNDPRAFVAYQKGVEQYEIGHGINARPDTLARANQYFEEATALVPNFLNAHKLHTDHLTHDLIAHANGVFTDSEHYEATFNALQVDLNRVVELARDPADRVNAELDRAFLSGDWRGLAGLTDRMAKDRGCISPVWPNFPAIFDREGSDILGRYRALTECDPLRHEPWVWLAESLIWQGKPDEAVQVAEEGLALLAHERVRRHLANAYLASGRLEDAAILVDRGPLRPHSALVYSAMVAAAQGDASKVAKQISRLEFMRSRRNAVEMYAWAGERDKANEVAAILDAHPFGYVVLSMATIRCFCGAPFDIEVTPNFAARLESAPFTWPPVSPIHWPLKDW